MHSFQAAVRVQAGDPLAHFRIGNTLFALKKYAEARKVRRACSRSDMPSAQGWRVEQHGRRWTMHAAAEQQQQRQQQQSDSTPCAPAPTRVLAGLRPRPQVLQARRG